MHWTIGYLQSDHHLTFLYGWKPERDSKVPNSGLPRFKLMDLSLATLWPNDELIEIPMKQRDSKWAVLDKRGAGRWSGDSVLRGEVNSAEGIGRQWSGLMSHETGFTGAEALPNPHAIHFAITMINRCLNASNRQCSCFDCTACQKKTRNWLFVVWIWLRILLSQLFGN